MAALINVDSACKFCGLEVHEEEELCAELSCTSSICGRSIYHTICIEQCLRKQGLSPDRMSGFQCPWGWGKVSLASGDGTCRGKITKIHRIVQKNKKKKAQALEVFPVEAFVKPTSVQPKPKQTAAQAAASRLAANKPTPVRSNTLAGQGPAPAALITAAQLREIKVALQKEVVAAANSKKITNTAPSIPNPIKASNVEFVAGSRAAARLGTCLGDVPVKLGKGKRTEAAFIPGLEVLEPKRQTRAGDAVKQTQIFHHNNAEFPALSSDGKHNNKYYDQAHAAKGKAYGTREKKEINALNPNHANAFVTDLDAYNALLGNLGWDLDDASDVEEVFVAAPEAPQAPIKLEEPPIPDELLFYAIQHGLEAAGLSEEHAAYVESVRNELLTDPAMWESLFGPTLTYEQQQEADRAAYLEAEEVVHQAEMAEAAAVAVAKEEADQNSQHGNIAAHLQPSAQQFVNVQAPVFPQATLALPTDAVSYAQFPYYTHPHSHSPVFMTAQAAASTIIPQKDVLLPQPITMAAPEFIPQQQAVLYQVPAVQYGGMCTLGVQVLASSDSQANNRQHVVEDEGDVDVDELLALLQV
ncbi:hypothetical protein CEUSTIGMA_g713.t1 [Chlamydomonas eustigma]|uniref:Uncharacterized protein n=1 Tax=Chlamydomonas eustigma TaxID=1157962 RepID=A0A250WRD9_9CHLO|nr:hypothetical protein CEUSTIGMA_g713.t1 [Chlamydomonas eustigma]|eukprot:GAX73259.1 hypothetical protein CEUSTIGMA_g713.t1 [Chlamydomonas eustigma]